MNAKLKLKLASIKFCRIALFPLRLCPIDSDKVLFISFDGKQISCNPFYIYKEFIRINTSKKLYWVVSNPKCVIPEHTHIIIKGSISFVYHILTAACVVTNDTLPSYLAFRSNQLVVNTWHGGGLFKQTYGNCTPDEIEYNTKINEIHNKDTKLYTLSGDAWYNQVVKKRFGYWGSVLSCGMPRNDVFFSDSIVITNKVKDYFNIPSNIRIVLYAPTFRGSTSDSSFGILKEQPIDIKRLIKALNKRFNGDYIFLFRGHHTLSATMDGCINASYYPDMQELLVASDFLISDFSSCLWDYSLSKKPSLIYAPDFEVYAEKPGFESDYREWPFAITHNNDELVSQILNFELEKYVNKVDKYHKDYGSFETGNASHQVVEYIVNNCL